MCVLGVAILKFHVTIHQESNYHDIDLASYYNSTMALKLNDERNSVVMT